MDGMVRQPSNYSGLYLGMGPQNFGILGRSNEVRPSHLPDSLHTGDRQQGFKDLQ